MRGNSRQNLSHADRMSLPQFGSMWHLIEARISKAGRSDDDEGDPRAYDHAVSYE
jgi:hypothetical protein